MRAKNCLAAGTPVAYFPVNRVLGWQKGRGWLLCATLLGVICGCLIDCHAQRVEGRKGGSKILPRKTEGYCCVRAPRGRRERGHKQAGNWEIPEDPMLLFCGEATRAGSLALVHRLPLTHIF